MVYFPKFKMLANVVIYMVLLCVAATAQTGIEIELRQGTLQGRYDQTWKGKVFRSFTGIPYAKPPVGKLRFKPPIPADPWNGVLDATKDHAVCPQFNAYTADYNIVGDENCLFLNVYAPEIKSNKKIAVMFYIHGGGWMCGSANSKLYGPHILLEKDVILVTINYRLGALGFLSTGDAVLPGNNGLKDQNLALKWVKDNIHNFGGDPNKITVFGQSAGAASTHLHTLSPISRDLMTSAIIQSGSALAPWAITLEPLEIAKRLASYLNCPTDASEAIVKCLSEIPAHEIVNKDVKFWRYSYDPMIPFKPVVEPNLEGAFLTEEPAEIIKSGKAAQIPLMTGFTTKDAALKVAALHKDMLIKELNEEFDRIAPYLFVFDQATYNTKTISNKIRKFYFGNTDINENTKSELTDAITDSWFYAPIDALIRMHTKYNKQQVYFYLFGYEGFTTYTNFYKHVDDAYNYGACHSDELLYLFSHKVISEKPMKKDEKMMETMTSLWSNFAKTGNPTPGDDQELVVKWNPVSSRSSEHYLISRNGNIQMSDNWHPGRLEFWRGIKFNARFKEIKDEL